jgi:hypothetical protein
MMRVIYGVGAMLLAVSGVCAAPPVTGVCEYQVRQYVGAELDQQVESIKFFWSGQPGAGETEEPSHAHVRVAECPGFHHFEIFATGETCTALPHYGEPPNYLFYRGGVEGC